MNMITFGLLEAQEGKQEALMDLIKDHLKYLKEQPGLAHAYIGKARGNSDKVLVVSVWENEEAQQAAMTNLSSDPAATASFFQLMQLLKGQPDFGNYLVESITK